MEISLFFQEMLNTGSSAFLAHAWIYPILFLLVLIEGPLAILIASSAATTGFLNPWPVFITAMIGNLVADVLWYLLGTTGKIEWILKLRWLKINPQAIHVLKNEIYNHAVKILFIAKITNGLIVPALIATGIAKVPWRRWFPMIFLTNVFVTGIFVIMGYFTAVSLMKIEHWVRYIAIAFSILLFFGATIYIQRLLKKKLSDEDYLHGKMEMGN